MKKISLFELYLIFVKIGAILLGGGYVILPILTSELSDKKDLINENELVDFYALSQSLPGIVAANISMFAGYKLRGKFGAMAAMFGIITIPFISIVCFASVLSSVSENIYVKGIFWGVGISVIALILLTTREIWQKSKRDWYFYIILLLSFIALVFLKLSPIQTIIIFTFLGVIIKKLSAKEENK